MQLCSGRSGDVNTTSAEQKPGNKRNEYLGPSRIKGEIIGVGLDADEVIAAPAELVFYLVCGFIRRLFRQGVFNLNLPAGLLALDEEEAVDLLAG